MSENRARTQPAGSSTAVNAATRLRRAQWAPPTSDDRSVLAGSGGQPASAEELRAFVAREQARIAQSVKR